MYIREKNSSSFVSGKDNVPINVIGEELQFYVDKGFEPIAELPETYKTFIFQEAPVNDRLLDVFNSLPMAVRAEFRSVKASIADCLADKQYEEAAYILTHKVEVPPELEAIKQNLISILNGSIEQTN